MLKVNFIRLLVMSIFILMQFAKLKDFFQRCVLLWAAKYNLTAKLFVLNGQVTRLINNLSSVPRFPGWERMTTFCSGSKKARFHSS